MGMVPKMNLDIRPIHRLFVGEVSGIDLRRPPDAATVAAIDRAMDQYAVLVFRGQPISEDEQFVFSSAFGTLDTGLTKIAHGKRRFKHPTTMDISNVMLDGAIAPAGHKKLASALANQLWHSDSSLTYLPVQCTTVLPVIW